MLEYLIEQLQEMNAAVVAGTLIALSVLVLIAGNKLKLPGGVELKGNAEELLQKTGRKLGNDVSLTILQKKMIQADLTIQPEYFYGFQFALPLIALVVFTPPAILGWIDIYWGVLIAILIYLTPGLWLNKKVKERTVAIKQDIPDFCMLLGNALNGADLLMALEVVAKAMPGELSREVNKALMDMATGDSRSVALNKMALRCGIPELTGLVNKILQAMRYGSTLGPVVKHHAENILNRRKHEAQKVAGELTIKLLFPIIIFILMPLFLMIGFPILWNMLGVFGN